MHQQPGPDMTQLHRARSGHLVWTRRRHHGANGSRQCRRDPDHGIVDGGEPSGRLSVGDGSARTRREDHPRRSAIYAHLGHGRHLGAAARRHRHSVSGRPDSLRPGERQVLPRIRAALHQRGDDHCARSFATPKTSAASSPAGTSRRKSTIPNPGSTKVHHRKDGGAAKLRRASPTRAAATAKIAAAKPAKMDEYETDPTLQHPRCVFQILKRHFSRYTPEMIERHAGVPQKPVPESRRGFLPMPPVRTRRRPSATPWDGRSTPRACRSSARQRSCSCCSATLGAPAAAFSPCADTLRSRVQPTFPHCMTSFPATCRCRSSRRTPTTSRAISRSTRPAPGCGRTSTSTSSA